MPPNCRQKLPQIFLFYPPKFIWKTKCKSNCQIFLEYSASNSAAHLRTIGVDFYIVGFYKISLSTLDAFGASEGRVHSASVFTVFHTHTVFIGYTDLIIAMEKMWTRKHAFQVGKSKWISRVILVF